MASKMAVTTRYETLTEIATLASFLRWLDRLTLEDAIWLSAR